MLLLAVATFLLSSLTSSTASPPSLCLYYNTFPCYMQ
nr:MAG TPA: hypothetical protein [Caudoviricetes sp.]